MCSSDLAIHDLETKPTVIVVGRRQERLDELAKSSERIMPVCFDVASGREALKQFAKDMVGRFPEVLLSQFRKKRASLC